MDRQSAAYKLANTLGTALGEMRSSVAIVDAQACLLHQAPDFPPLAELLPASKLSELIELARVHGLACTKVFTPIDGNPHQLSISPIYSASDTVVVYLLQLRPPTTHQAPELNAVLDALFAFVGLLSPDGILLDANRPPLDSAGIAAKDVLGLKFWDCYWWSYDPAIQDQLKQAINRTAAGETLRYDVVVRMKGDSRMALDFMLAPLRNAQGNVIQLVASAIDISDRRAGEEALYRSEERFRHVFEGAPDGIAMVDSHGRMVLVNGAMERLFGYSRSEMVGHSIELLIPQRYLPNHHQWRTAYMQEPTTRDMAGRKELYARRKDNSEFAAEIGLNPLRLPDGVFVLATVFDVTKRRADQQTIERALLEKTALLNEVHHRVKNNLQVISSLLNLQSRHAPPEARQLLTESQGRVKAMALIHQLLYERHDYSRVNLAYYLGRLGALLTDSFTEQRGRIVIEQHFDGNETTIDLQRAVPCGLIVNELVTNALKHAFPDGRSGRISISLEQADNGYCRIIVADDGVGLPDAIQLDNATSLGFQLVPLLADQLGGQLSIERTQGTRFILSIPPSTGEDQ